jgi:aspartyl-tRNA synthetase
VSKARKLGREYVIQQKDSRERVIKIPTRHGDIEIEVCELNILNASELPPFTIETKDGEKN